MSLILSRREWIKRMSLVGMSAAVAPVLPRPAAQSAGRSDYKTYFGDLHITTSSATRKGRSSGPLRSPATISIFLPSPRMDTGTTSAAMKTGSKTAGSTALP